MPRAPFAWLLSLLSAVACAPAGAPPEHAPLEQASKQGSPEHAPPERASKQGSLDEERSQQRHRPRPLLELPSDPDFLRAPLPPADPSRYATWRETARIEVGQSHLVDVDRLPSGRLLALSHAEGAVRVYERSSRRLVAQHPLRGFREFEPATVLAWPAAPDRFVAASPAGLGVYDAASGALLEAVSDGPTWKLRWSADTRILMAGVSNIDAQSSILRFFARGAAPLLTPLGELAFAERVDAWDLSADSRLLALALYPSDSLLVLDLATGEEIFRGAAPRYAGDVTFSPDGRYLAAVGDGVLVVDLLNTDRRAFYSHVKNNGGHVRFSPSGDALAASAYDGRVRIWTLERDDGALRLQLAQQLAHAGDANVYTFVFAPDGSELVSASGDRTLRAFGARAAKPLPGATTAASGATRIFRNRAAWKELDPAGAAPLPPPPETRFVDGRLVLSSELTAPRPSRIEPGTYACKITQLYKLRDCFVTKDGDGRTWLEFAPDNLLHLRGILYDDGAVVRYEAELATPSDLIDCAGCERQPLHAVFRGQSGHYQGLLTFKNYHDPQVPPPLPPPDVRIEEANDRYPLVLEFRRR